MDNNYSTTNFEERKRGQHLKAEDRGAIQQLKRLGYSNRAIAKQLNCSPTTVGNELKRGTKAYCGRGRKPEYSAKRGYETYKKNRQKSHRPVTIARSSVFINWVAKQVRDYKWSFDVCVGYAKIHNLFPNEKIPCTKTLYNLLWSGELPISLFDLPEVLKRRKRGKPRISKKSHGKSIDERPLEVSSRTTFGHWESDTVVGKKKKGEPAVFTIVERLTGYYLSIRISEKTTVGVEEAMKQLHSQFGEHFRDVFKSITTDNGNEFATFSQFEEYLTKIYFAHPYSAWERPVNERTNRLLRKFIPKGKTITAYTDDEILQFADQINSTPRKRLNYQSPEELFDEQLDIIYSTR